ncbi:hypothetical protein CAPTEDRAFT_186251 [Capitella teleta]|uniref:Endonuclease/exonuclease/phosphatase domain-containing protein n=1 Tax=Capitella teleta TaxID=283909 RepID=R7T6N0_CAPTE|nr:hypothetical protein CAPTEDRAFT_186251 [Capitella teleta]|eukprot:ELT89219.1 hypothetical protein CAPTEDRAFT_186251 [Capitella teleta]
MDMQENTNPILPAAGVRRRTAGDCSTSHATITGGWRDDEGSSNPSGREPSDNSTASNALLRCKKPFTMATFNANTVREEGRARELAHCFKQCNIDILGIQEHRRVHVEETQNLSQAAVGGVGLMLSPKARKALRTVTPITERILVAEYDSNPVTTVIVIYSPTNVAPVEEAEAFYEKLGEIIRDVPAHNFLAVLGDFNARLGPEDALYLR